MWRGGASAAPGRSNPPPSGPPHMANSHWSFLRPFPPPPWPCPPGEREALCPRCFCFAHFGPCVGSSCPGVRASGEPKGGMTPRRAGSGAAAALRHVAALIVATLFTRCHGDAAADQNKRRSEGLGGPPRARRHASGVGRREGGGGGACAPSGPPRPTVTWPRPRLVRARRSGTGTAHSGPPNPSTHLGPFDPFDPPLPHPLRLRSSVEPTQPTHRDLTLPQPTTGHMHEVHDEG